ncbi:MAG: TetR/AcrR family transcriptional regulator [Bacteroidales bacterium]|nr:MAG: TetR/AcrR family transcriptional regulator [Bacteroidales bacterium]
MTQNNIKESYDEKFRQITGTGKELFFKYGIKRVTIEEICREAGVSKMTFYKHFNNKIDLVKRIIDLLVSENLTSYRELMERIDITFEEKVRLTIQMKLEGTSEIGDTFYDDYLVKSDPELASYIQIKSGSVFKEVLKDYIEAQERGDIRKDIKPEFILFFLNHIFELAKNEKLLKLYMHPWEVIMELVNFFFYGIMSRK